MWENVCSNQQNHPDSGDRGLGGVPRGVPGVPAAVPGVPAPVPATPPLHKGGALFWGVKVLTLRGEENSKNIDDSTKRSFVFQKKY